MFRKSTQQEIEEAEKEFDDSDIALNAPLDVRYVVVGLLMMVLSLPLATLFQNQIIRYIFGISFLASFVVVTKRKEIAS